MIVYNRNVEPPAPFLDVTVQHPTTRQQLPFPAKLDTGADISAIPATAAEQLRLLSVRSIPIEGYNSKAVFVPTYAVAMNIAGARFRLEVIVITEPYVLIGRDVLNYFYARLNGPDLTFDLSLSPSA
jgi:predicted aspartyl protease